MSILYNCEVSLIRLFQMVSSFPHVSRWFPHVSTTDSSSLVRPFVTSVNEISSSGICYPTVRSLQSLSCAWGKWNSGICGAASDQSQRNPWPSPSECLNSEWSQPRKCSQETKLTKHSDLVDDYIYMTSLPFWNTLAIPRLLSPTLPVGVGSERYRRSRDHCGLS